MISLTYRKEGYKFPELPIQTTIIDPPYNIGFNYKSDFKDKMTPEEYNKFIYDCIEGCYHHSTDDANLFLINYPEIIFDLYLAIDHSSWNINQYIHWIYKPYAIAKNRFSKGTRTIVWLTKNNSKIYIDRVMQDYALPNHWRNVRSKKNGSRGTHLYDWWEIPFLRKNNKEHLGYVNQIPYELLRRLILTTTDENDVVYDPMCGSGSTVFAAGHLQRIGIGYDISPKSRDIWDKYTINPYTALGYKR